MKSKSNCFYTNFLNETNFINIGNIEIQRKFWVYFFSIPVFSIACTTFPAFVGFNFSNVFSICMFCWDMLMYFLLIFFTIKFILLERKYFIFKRKYYSYLFCFGFILLSVIFTVLAAFITEFISGTDGSFHVNINPACYFLIFIPLFFSFLSFCYYAFMQCFGKYTITGRKQNGSSS